MELYLPIAEMSVDMVVLLGLGAIVGFLSGMFGVGGGFLMTPLLIFMGIPPAVAVGTQALQILASSFSSVLNHIQRGSVDLKMGAVLVGGGILGSSLGIVIFRIVRDLGYIDVTIAFSYVILLGTVGATMLNESLRTVLQTIRPRGSSQPKRSQRHGFAHRWPLKLRFPRSRLYISALLPALIGGAVGILTAIMGVGGGFVMIPAMIYLIKMPASIVVGTSLFQITFVAALTTFLQATFNHTVDIVLGLLLIVGGVIGAQIGTRVALQLRGEYMRLALALLIILVCLKLVWDLISTPTFPFELVN
ncbi:sulfite exporter TauE/SafE family protein [Geminicoccus roseus]|uniref:sulfite exporter TauE/SafE family protein n=1 Tax=Geminicoccus roseus TaxID=404900 RepID=UPI0004260D46|nr:sulfite exporter TauE/SafE family protein [Geminicoccus roseus]